MYLHRAGVYAYGYIYVCESMSVLIHLVNKFSPEIRTKTVLCNKIHVECITKWEKLYYI